MADQKRWFKVWTSILDDPHFQELPLEDVGRWVFLGALIAGVGAHGRLSSPSGARRLRQILRADTITDLKVVISRLPNVSFEEGKNDNDDFIVTMAKWSFYQVDNTVAQRVKRLRSKRREEEKRREERRREEKKGVRGTRTPPPTIVFQIPEAILAVLTRCPRLGRTSRLRDPTFWQAEFRANPGVNFEGELLKAEAYLVASNGHYRDLGRFVHGWFGRAERER